MLRFPRGSFEVHRMSAPRSVKSSRHEIAELRWPRFSDYQIEGAREMDKRSTSTDIELRSIMVATDFSAASGSVLTHAAAIAHRYRSKLYVTHIISNDIYKAVPAEVMAEAVKQTRVYVQNAMENVLRREWFQHVQHETVIEEGQVAPTLLRLAAEYNVDLLVVGTRGYHGLERLLQGSVAEEVFRQASCPVLIVPPRATDQARTNLRTVLYSTDFSDNSLHAAPYAFSLARRHHGRLILLHVLQQSAVESHDDQVRLRTSVEERLRELGPAKDALSSEPLLYVEFGPIEQRIVRVAVENHADLIVLGIAGARAAVAHLIEGLTYKIVRAAPCPVLTIRG
jgi:nucleotide-binding universal stress UspA family protein